MCIRDSYYGDPAEDLMDPFQQELELLGNLCLRDLRLAAAGPDGVELQMVNDLPPVEGGWRLPDLALSLIHISEPTRPYKITYAAFCLKKNMHQ